MAKRSRRPLVSIVLIMLAASSARAQYQGIPNYTGPGAGRNFRNDINARFAGVMPISPLIVSRPFATLPAEQDGLILFCNDCARTTPCSGGGIGAFAEGVRGVWSCSNATLEENLSAAGHSLNGLAGLTVNNDSLAEHDIAHFSINGEVNVRDPKYGASASTTRGTATLNGTTAATLDTVHDFAVGQHIAIYGAGAASALTAPALTVAPQTYQDSGTGVLTASNKGFTTGQLIGCWVDNINNIPAWQASHSYVDNGGNANDEIVVSLDGQWYGFYHSANTSFTSGATPPDFKSVLHAPGGPSGTMGTPWTGSSHVSDNGDFGWTPFGIISPTASPLANTACNVTYIYKACPVDANGGIGTCSSTATINGTGTAVLSPSMANVLTITNPAGTVADIIGRCTGAACTPGFYSLIPVYGSSTGAQTYFDIGNAQGQYLDAGGAKHLAAPDGSAPMPSVVNAPLLTTIASCGTSTPGAACTSTSFTLANAATASGGFTMLHDDGPAINAAITAAAATSTTGAGVYVPAGSYNVATPISFNNTAGIRFHGEAGVGSNTVLYWIGGIGGNFVTMYRARNHLVQNLKFTGVNGATPATGFDIDSTAVAGTSISTRDSFMYDSMSFIANPIRISNTSVSNDENMTFQSINLGDGSDGGYAAVYIAGAAQTDLEQFKDIVVSYGPWNYLFALGLSQNPNSNANVGSLYVDGFETGSTSVIGVYLQNTVKRLALHNWHIDQGLPRLFYDGSGFSSSVTIDSSYFNPFPLPADGFYTVQNKSGIASFNNVWGNAGVAEVLKVNLGIPTQTKSYSGRFASFNDRFADAQGIFTPWNSGAPFKITLENASGLTDTGDATSANGAAFHINGALIAPTNWGGVNSLGRVTTAKVGTIAAPTVTPTGTDSAQTHNYYQVCHDANGGTTAISAAGTTTHSVTVANLNAANYNTITWPYYPGCVSFDVYRDATSGSALLASNVTQTVVSNAAPIYQVLDQGQAVSSSTAPLVDTTGDNQVAGAFSAGSIATISNGSMSVNGNGLLGEGTTTFASLAAACAPGQEIYCSDCKNVSDGITMASTCVGSGTGSIAVCKSSNTWKCGK